MGGVVSTSKITSLIQILKQENCSSIHYVWQGISVDDMANLNLSNEDINDLLLIQKMRPDNFSELVRITVDVFSKASKISEKENSQNPNYVYVCNFICLLLSISNDSKSNIVWFRASQLYLSAVKPIMSLSETLQRLLRFNDSIITFLQSSILDLRISYAKTLLFIVHAQSLGGNQICEETSTFLSIFDFFHWNQFLITLFETIYYVIAQSKSSQKNSLKELILIRALISFAIPCLYACQSWKIEQIDVKLIHKAFSVLFLINNEKVIQICEQLVSLLYIVISTNHEFLEYIVSNSFTNNYVISLLFLYQHRLENQKMSFFHTLILLIMGILTSNYSALLLLNDPISVSLDFKMRTHRGTHADLLIEVLTNPFVQNFEVSAPLIPLISGIIKNISSITVKLSWFSANRIFIILKKFFVSKFAEKKEYSRSVENMIASIYQFLRFQTIGNMNLFMYSIENQIFLKKITRLNQNVVNPNVAHHNWKFYIDKILLMVKKGEKTMMIANEQQRIKEYQNLLAPVLLDFNDPPEKLNDFSMNREIESIWIDWFRVLFWITFPEDATKANLSFTSFETPNMKKENQKEYSSKPDQNLKTQNTQEESINHENQNQQPIQKSDQISIQNRDNDKNSQKNSTSLLNRNHSQTISGSYVVDSNDFVSNSIENDFNDFVNISIENEYEIIKSIQEIESPEENVEDLFGGDSELMKFLEGD
ncbi:hypothetical protein TRFO_22820 [Tritrichomonas foetus]|uniref:Dymeclin n=1 Tax=Tritrichomonas foetus TaxID=1144522 RepID=A0A1J4KFZ9_9EUKA|nr:hypothetical protein TRFO_22820 [Tritrichomonas foetus]|eukprot:OHT08566.1 hypothetical protein TRFO_22820 [Tritrichomonas foetus]